MRWLIVCVVAFMSLTAHARADDLLEWSELPPLPDPIGFAGAYAGVSNGALIVAGGANFPGGRPWDGHPKIWHDRVFVLESPEGQWIEAATRLPRPLGYGVSVTWNETLICLGGGDAIEHSADVFALRWNGSDVEIEPLQPLPTPVAFFSGALVGSTIHVAGGIDTPLATRCLADCYALDLADPGAQWKRLEPFPGPERHLSVAGAHNGAFHVFSGIRLHAGSDGAPARIRPYLTDAWRYTTETGWEQLADLPRPVAAAPSPAIAVGPAHVFVFGGDDGSLGGSLQDAHPGFDPTVHAYHAITNTWTPIETMPRDLGPDPGNSPNLGVWPPVTATVVEWYGRFVIATGEVRPGVRSPRVLAAQPRSPPSGFSVLDYTVLVLYMIGLIAMGIRFARREKGTGDFFLAGRRIPAWAAGVSIFGTQLSAITFLAIPAKSYASDWVYFLMNMGIVVMAPVVVTFYLPFFRRLEVTSAYEYLEARFSLGIRLLGSASFIAFQIGRMAIVMFLPALALAAVTGIDVATCIVIMGVLCTLYTVLGGIEAVIWTDVAQVFVLMGGALVALLVVVANVDGGFGGIIEIANEGRKLRIVDVGWDWTRAAVGVVVLGAVFNNLVPYTTDQSVIQRYLTTRDERSAARAVWTGALLAVPASILFFAMGTALYAFYHEHPGQLNPTGSTDQIFAWFIVRELPAGLAGLLIAGVFAAAMSSLDSSMNSIATAVTTDFYRRFDLEASDKACLRFARILTVILGVVGTGTALVMTRFEIKSLLDQFLATLGLMGGPLAGLFVLGIFTRRASSAAACIGLIAAIAMLLAVRAWTPITGLVYAAIGTSTCVVVGLIASVVWPQRGSIEGLCWQDIRSRS